MVTVWIEKKKTSCTFMAKRFFSNFNNQQSIITTSALQEVCFFFKFTAMEGGGEQFCRELFSLFAVNKNAQQNPPLSFSFILCAAKNLTQHISVVGGGVAMLKTHYKSPFAMGAGGCSGYMQCKIKHFAFFCIAYIPFS